ncbi:hypothetical protein Srufu_078800 [Streptomyces libani subsp. rufus]|nr:hypothetical protein Srufu_078800 [Streptomyces libani subsp. rufus]
MLVRLVGGPLGRRKLSTDRARGPGLLTAGDADWVVRPRARELVTGISWQRLGPPRRW